METAYVVAVRREYIPYVSANTPPVSPSKDWTLIQMSDLENGYVTVEGER